MAEDGTRPGIAGLLAHARAGLTRVSAQDAWRGVQSGRCVLVDIRPEHQRRRDGDIPGAWVVGRNVLEWRLDPATATCAPWASYEASVVVLCDEGYSSSLAAAALQQLGIKDATDVLDGMRGWLSAGLPTAPYGSSHDLTEAPK